MSCTVCGENHEQRETHVFSYVNDGAIDIHLKDPISMEPIFDGQELPCGHVFSSSIIRDWLRRDGSCPTCKQHVVEAQLKPVGLMFRNMLDALQVSSS